LGVLFLLSRLLRSPSDFEVFEREWLNEVLGTPYEKLVVEWK
jgi:hypothetical protein